MLELDDDRGPVAGAVVVIVAAADAKEIESADDAAVFALSEKYAVRGGGRWVGGSDMGAFGGGDEVCERTWPGEKGVYWALCGHLDGILLRRWDNRFANGWFMEGGGPGA